MFTHVYPNRHEWVNIWKTFRKNVGKHFNKNAHKMLIINN